MRIERAKIPLLVPKSLQRGRINRWTAIASRTGKSERKCLRVWFSTESRFYDVYTMFAYSRGSLAMYYDRMQNTGIDKMEEDGGIRIFCFLKHEAGFSCSSELDHLSHLIGSPLAPQILEMVDRISFKIYIECRDFFFFIAYWVQLRKRNLCDWLLVLLTNSPSFFSFFVLFNLFLCVCVEVLLFN